MEILLLGVVSAWFSVIIILVAFYFYFCPDLILLTIKFQMIKRTDC